MENKHKKYSLKLNKVDIILSIIIVFLLVASIILTNIFYNGNISSKGAKVEIHLKNDIVYSTYIDDLKDNETYITLSKETYESLLGDMIIEINKEKGIRVKEVTCPNHICYNQGYVKNVGIPITCVPNHVFVVIIKDSDKDSSDVIM